VKKLSFLNLLVTWFFVTMILTALNGWTLKSTLLQNFIQASLGIYLLIWPTWPERLGWWYSEKTCRRIVRITAVVIIVLAFLTKFNF